MVIKGSWHWKPPATEIKNDDELCVCVLKTTGVTGRLGGSTSAPECFSGFFSQSQCRITCSVRRVSQPGFPPELKCQEAEAHTCCSGYLHLQCLAGSWPSPATNETCSSQLPGLVQLLLPVSVVTALGSAKTR